jgi:heptosyltransferase-1
MGDVVHNLPVIADLQSALGEVTIDWVVERAFASIPAMHPGVRSVIPCELRRWRRSWMHRDTRAQWRAFVERLRGETYDAIIDTQALLKSAIVARLARGRRFGLDWRSSREPVRPFYDQVFSVPWDVHAVERNRRLCALALGYPVTGAADYGIRASMSRASWLPGKRFVVLLHATSHHSKLWPEAHWVELGRRFTAAGYASVLPWGSATEQERARRLSVMLPESVVPEKMNLDQLAGVMAEASAVIGVDTGLTHLAAALRVPVVGIYGATDPGATGVYSSSVSCNVGARGRFPAVDEVWVALAKVVGEAGEFRG